MKIDSKIMAAAIAGFAFSLLLISGCASMGTPGGGPVDEEAPVIVHVSPTTGSTGIDPETVFEITFSENIDRESLIESLFITPPPVKKPKLKFRGRRVQIILSDPIPDDRTLVLSIGTGVKDLRRNYLEESLAIAVTAGDNIDQGRISGLVFSAEKVQGVLVGAWIIGDSTVIDPMESPPEYLTQTSEKGEFALDYLPAGLFRVLCWDDRDHDRFYDPAADRLGLPWRDIELEKDSAAWIELYSVKRDTAQMKLLVISAADNRHVSLRFNKTVEQTPEKMLPGITITDSFSVLHLQRGWIDVIDSSKLILYTDEQVQDRAYQLVMFADTTIYSFTGSAVPDSIGPRLISSSPHAADKGVSENPDGWLGFDDAINVTGMDTLLNLTLISEDSTLQDSLTQEVICRQEDVHLLTWSSVAPLRFGENYKLEFNLSGVHDLENNSSPDSIWSIEFSTIDPVETGSISGELIDPISNVVVAARPLEGRRTAETSAKVKNDGTFEVERLNAGDYRIWAFADKDRDGLYDSGKLNPFKFADRFTVIPDTMNVRERWETGGVSIRFR